MSFRRSMVPIVLAVAVCGAGVSSCSPSKKPDVGRLVLALTLPAGIVISTVSYNVLSGTNVSLLSGTVDVSDPNASPSFDLALPPSSGDRVSLSATTISSPVRTFTGTSSAFNIVSNQQILVSVTLTDTVAASSPAGTVLVNGTIVPGNHPPVISSATVAPSKTSTNAPIDVRVTAIDPDGDTLTYAWTATAGSFVAPGASATTYSCPVGGPQMITITVTDNHLPVNASTTVTLPVTLVATALSCGAPNNGVWPDLSGHGHDATLKNFGAGSGLVGDGTPANAYAVNFDGVDDVAELAPGLDGLRLTNEATLEIWVNNFFAEGVGTYNNLYSNRNGVEYSGFFGGIVNPGNIGDSQWYAGNTPDGVNWVLPLLTTPGRPPSSVWSHFVATFSLTQGTSGLFINGVQVASQAMTSPIFYSAAAVPRVGGDVAGSNFRGKIGEVIVWAAALDPSEVAARYQAGAPSYGIVAPGPTLTVTKPIALRLEAAPCP